MKEITFSKQAIKKIKQLKKSDPSSAKRVKNTIVKLQEGRICGESLQ